LEVGTIIRGIWGGRSTPATQQADFLKFNLNITAFLLDFNKLLYCSIFHAEYYTK
jgi:hypothetical protein